MPLFALLLLSIEIVLATLSTVTNEVSCPALFGVTVIAYEMSESRHEVDVVSVKEGKTGPV